ncbi:MAG: aminotransferase class III-fold pyridoxal phosphate-dependent enzyme [Holophagaceae bacterium]|nr:aminotransferase class III-fold pyridoxal phosphate-dependent enzyme [Holophagaceae bacterium]
MHTISLPALLPTYAAYPFPILKGHGDRVFDDDGIAYWDFYGGHCVCATGHCHPTVVDAISAQAGELIFYATAARIPLRDQAAHALVEFADGPASVFFCNSGAEAVENALKVALKLTGRKAFLAFEGSFHGRTLLALSVTDDANLRKDYEDFLVPTTFLPFGDMGALDAVDFTTFAAVILEPIQSMAGVKTTDMAWFQAVRTKCDTAGTILIFDEVQTGFGRLGKPFAAHVYGVQSDITTCAKSIASGIPMGALLLSGKVASQLKPGDLGSTFGGGPIACAALLATLSVIHSEGLMERAQEASRLIQSGSAGTVVSAVQGEGLLLGLRVGSQAGALKKFLQSKRILVGGSGDPGVLRLMPPLNLSDEAIQALVDTIHEFSEKTP